MCKASVGIRFHWTVQRDRCVYAYAIVHAQPSPATMGHCADVTALDGKLKINNGYRDVLRRAAKMTNTSDSHVTRAGSCTAPVSNWLIDWKLVCCDTPTCSLQSVKIKHLTLSLMIGWWREQPEAATQLRALRGHVTTVPDEADV